MSEPTHDGRAAASTSDPAYAQLTASTWARFICSGQGEIPHRIGLSHTSLCVHFTDCEPIGCTLYLDGDKLSAKTEVDPDAEAHVYGPTNVFASIILGRKHMALAIAKGEIAFTGPVRKFLRAVPMMRQLDIAEIKELAAASVDRLDTRWDSIHVEQ
jgi:hypothetical protein